MKSIIVFVLFLCVIIIIILGLFWLADKYVNIFIILNIAWLFISLFFLYRSKFIYNGLILTLHMAWARYKKLVYNYDYSPYTFNQLLDMFPSHTVLLYKYFWNFNLRSLAKDKAMFDYVMKDLTTEDQVIVVGKNKDYATIYEAIESYYARLGEKNV